MAEVWPRDQAESCNSSHPNKGMMRICQGESAWGKVVWEFATVEGRVHGERLQQEEEKEFHAPTKCGCVIFTIVLHDLILGVRSKE